MNDSQKRAWLQKERPSGVLLIWVLCLLLAGMGAMTLQAASYTTFRATLTSGGGPAKGESGWINLPYVRGISPLNPNMGKVLFKQLKDFQKSLPTNDPNGGPLSSGGTTLVLEGKEGGLLPTQVLDGQPCQTVVWVNSEVSMGLLSGPLVVKLDPTVIHPEINSLSLSVPGNFIGAIVRVIGPGINDSYGVIEDGSITLSWSMMQYLAKLGVDQITLAAISTNGEFFDLKMEIEECSGHLTISLGM